MKRSILTLFLLAACEAPLPTPVGPTATPYDPLEPIVVTSAGGTFEFGDAVLEFPSGAVREPIEVRFIETDQAPHSDFTAYSSIWVAEPAPLELQIPASVTLPYEPAGASRPTLYWSTFGAYGELADSTVGDGVVTGSITQLSSGFVAQAGLETVELDVWFPPADVLFVIDNSCSMFEEQTAVADAMPDVLPVVEQTGLDVHLGVVSTDMSDTINHAGKLQQRAGQSWVEPGMPDGASIFGQMALMGTGGAFEEKGRAAAYTMVELKPDIPENTGFLRDDGTLVFVFVSDEEDQSGAFPVTRGEFRQWMETVRARPEDVVAHAIIDPPGQPCPEGDTDGQEYNRYANWTGGIVANLCDTDWVTPLQDMMDGVLDTGRVELPEVPDFLFSVERIRADGTVDTLSSADWSRPVDSRWVYFDQGFRPEIGDSIRVRYQIP